MITETEQSRETLDSAHPLKPSPLCHCDPIPLRSRVPKTIDTYQPTQLIPLS